MKKNRKLYFALGVSGILVLLAGIFLLTLGVIDAQSVTNNHGMLFRILGGLSIFLSVPIMVFGLLNYYKSNKELMVEEKDERNIALRGKAAEKTCLFNTFLLLAAMLICIVINALTASLIIAAAMLISSFFHLFLIAYYNKKM